MAAIEIRFADGSVREMPIEPELLVGRGSRCDLQLPGWRVAAEHARIIVTPAGVLLHDLGSFAGTSVDGEPVEGTVGPLRPDQWVAVGAHRLRVVDGSPAVADAGTATPSPGPSAGRPLDAAQPTAAAWPVPPAADAAPDPTDRAQLEAPWRRRVHARLLETMDLRRHDISTMSDGALRTETDRLEGEIVDALAPELPPGLDAAELRRQVLDEAVGLGPLEALLADDSITEVMVNRHDQIFVERGGRLERHPLAFTDDRAVLGVIERIVAPLGRRIDEASPMVDARLKDGSRVNAVIPPLALKGPCLTIRKFARRKLTADDLVRGGSMSPAMATFLEVCVRSRRNIVVAGGTGSGKTTLLNILSNFIPPGERVITVEDAAELQLPHAHLVSLEARPANGEGKGAVSIRELVRNTLRMRPDRIVVGECRGAEALDMLQAMNTGHEGSLTTLHANTPRDALARLETMVLMAGMDLPLTAIREQIASAVDIVVQQTRFACGSRRVTAIVEVTGMESGTLQTQELFRFQPWGSTGADGRAQGSFLGCDAVPEFYDELRVAGAAPDVAIFRGPAAAAA